METTLEEKYYQSIHDLPLNKFIDCMVDGNLSALIISGFPQPELLAEAWDNILGEYSDIIGSQEQRMIFQLWKEVAVIKISVDQIRILAAREKKLEDFTAEEIERLGIENVMEMLQDKGILRMVYIKEMADELNRILGTTCTFNWNDQKTYNDELDKCVNRGKALLMQYDLKSLQFAAMQKQAEGDKTAKIDRQYFTSILITLSDHVKYRIEETIKMSEYCERVKKFSDYCEQIKNKPK